MKFTGPCATCGKTFSKKYAANRNRPRYCCRACCDADKGHQRRKSQATAATRWPGDRTHTFSCLGCSRTVTVRKTKRATERQYCSMRCKYRRMVRNETITFTCRVCGASKTDKVRPGRTTPMYCSKKCMGKDPERNIRLADVARAEWADPAIRASLESQIKERCQTEEYKAARRDIMLRAYARGAFDEKMDTAPARAVAAMLNDDGVDYEREWVRGHYSFDFYIPAANLCVEVNGDYWHGNPEVYPAEKLTAKQRRRQNMDKTKASYIRNRGFGLLTLWEKDITTRPDECRAKLREALTATRAGV